jgi:hypothetical protein
LKLPRRDQLCYRLAGTEMSVGPISYDRHRHTVEAVISMGSPVKRNCITVQPAQGTRRFQAARRRSASS